MPSAATPDWLDAPYVRVYITLVDDQPAIWRDDALLAWWIRLLVGADRYYPASAPLPVDVPAIILDSLAAAGIVELVGGTRYTFKGVGALRSSIGNRGRAGGLARARTGARNAGRFAGPVAGVTTLDDAGDLNVTTSRPTLDDDAGDDAGDTVDDAISTSVAGDQRKTLVPATRHDTTRHAGHPPPSGVQRVADTHSTREDDAPTATADAPPSQDPLTPGERAAMVRAHGPDDAPCESPELHPLHHRFYVGVGWRCLLCEGSDTRSFDDLMVQYGGRPF